MTRRPEHKTTSRHRSGRSHRLPNGLLALCTAGVLVALAAGAEATEAGQKSHERASSQAQNQRAQAAADNETTKERRIKTARARRPSVRLGPTTITVIDENDSIDDIISRVRARRDVRQAAERRLNEAQRNVPGGTSGPRSEPGAKGDKTAKAEKTSGQNANGKGTGKPKPGRDGPHAPQLQKRADGTEENARRRTKRPRTDRRDRPNEAKGLDDRDRRSLKGRRDLKIRSTMHRDAEKTERRRFRRDALKETRSFERDRAAQRQRSSRERAERTRSFRRSEPRRP